MKYYGYMEDTQYTFFLLEFINGMELFETIRAIRIKFKYFVIKNIKTGLNKCVNFILQF